MSDKEILNILAKHYLNAEDNIREADEVAISEIKKLVKDYARKMCDEQKELCIEDWNDTEEGDVLRDYSAIKNAPYPKELQQ